MCSITCFSEIGNYSIKTTQRVGECPFAMCTVARRQSRGRRLGAAVRLRLKLALGAPGYSWEAGSTGLAQHPPAGFLSRESAKDGGRAPSGQGPSGLPDPVSAPSVGGVVKVAMIPVRRRRTQSSSTPLLPDLHPAPTDHVWPDGLPGRWTEGGLRAEGQAINTATLADGPEAVGQANGVTG